MKIAECELESLSAYSQSKHIETQKNDGELDRDHEARCWRERCNVDAEGMLFIPPMALAMNIKTAARYLDMKVPGKGSSKYTKHFEAGILVPEPVTLSVNQEEVEGEWLFVDSQGKKGGGRRVSKCFPYVPNWAGRVLYYILDDIIDEPTFRKALDYGGNVIGIGRFRPERGGFKGRFKVNSVVWVEQ